MLMNGNLIDTNIIIKLLGGDEQVVLAFSTLENIHISVITVGELAYGAGKSKKKQANQQLFDEFTDNYSVEGVNGFIAKMYGQVKTDLVKQGKNIPENDLWIAATAIYRDFTLITCDHHFESIPNLKCKILGI